MTGLCRRVRALETNASVTGWNNNFAEAENLALNRMPSSEREVLKAVIAHAHDAPRIDLNGDLWHRWETVFDRAVVEARCPVALSATDMML